MTAFDAWLPWLYQYGVGGVLAAATAAFSIKVGAVDLDRKRERRLAACLAAGYFGFMAVHAVWIWAVYP
jgi:hypothetical protein